MCGGVLRQLRVRIGVGAPSCAGLDGDMCEFEEGQGWVSWGKMRLRVMRRGMEA